jgi:hypothetical protein
LEDAKPEEVEVGHKFFSFVSQYESCKYTSN